MAGCFQDCSSYDFEIIVLLHNEKAHNLLYIYNGIDGLIPSAVWEEQSWPLYKSNEEAIIQLHLDMDSFLEWASVTSSETNLNGKDQVW